MDDLEYIMNIDELFEKYEERKSYVINLKHSFVDIFLTGLANSNMCLRIICRSDSAPYYKIFMYSKTKNSLYYTHIDEEIIEGKEAMINHAREHHPDFLEWMIWNLL